MRTECYFCHIKTVQRLIEKHNPENEIAEDFIFSVNELLSENRNMPNPKLATDIHRIAREKLNNEDLYIHEKRKANTSLLEEYSHWKNYIIKSNDAFFNAAKLAVVGNIIDYGAHSLKGDLKVQINTLLSNQLRIDQIKELEAEVQKAKSILYIGDNAGEIVFDKLFIETMNHPNITYATRGKPVINDITLDDAKEIQMDNICKIISNGFDAPSTLLEFCSSEFMEIYNEADLIISKGQGNFEGLMTEKHPNTFFMLIAKCKPIAELLDVNINDMVITKLN